MSLAVIKREHYTVTVEDPTVYVDNKARRRSGHMTHAMAEFAPGTFIDFNSSCSPVRLGGHSAFGWVESRISRDAGRTYGPVRPLQLSCRYLLDGEYTISVEKAVALPDGSIVAFCLRNSMEDPVCCEPWATPLSIRSTDGGATWTEPIECIPYRGRIYDALVRDGVIYVLIKCYEHFIGTTPDHVYRVYRSTDGGQSFELLSVPPIDGIGRGYGSLLFGPDGTLHCYGYNVNAETEMDHAVSTDNGATWTLQPPCHVALGIRNPQTALLDGVFILHGRSGDARGFVLYTSEDGSTWDEGTWLIQKEGACYYSNNLNLHDDKGDFLLIQYSDLYESDMDVEGKFNARVNVMHTVVRVAERPQA